MNYTNVNGFSSKYHTIPLLKNKAKYQLNTNETFGLLSTDIIHYIYFRQSGLSATNKTINNANLYQGTLNLQDRTSAFIIDRVNLTNLANVESSSTPQPNVNIPPTQADKISWTGSYLEFANPNALVDTEDVDMVILYSRGCTPDAKIEEITKTLNYNGIVSPSVRQMYLEVNVNTANQTFQLSTNGITAFKDNDYIVGYTLNKNPNVVSTKNLPNAGSIADSAFMNLVIKGAYNMLNNMPLSINQPANCGLQWFPIEPVRNRDIDWQSSNIFLPNPTILPAPEAAFIFTFYYISC